MRIINRVINAVTFAVILTAIVSGMMLSRHILLDLPFHNPASWVRKVHMTSVHWGMLILALHWVALENAGNLFLPDPEHRRRLTLCKCHYAGDFFAHCTTGFVLASESELSRLFADEG
jgi:hypothetical protein